MDIRKEFNTYPEVEDKELFQQIATYFATAKTPTVLETLASMIKTHIQTSKVPETDYERGWYDAMETILKILYQYSEGIKDAENSNRYI